MSNSNVITFEAAVQKRNDARTSRRKLFEIGETRQKCDNALYDWGFWDAVITLMKNLGLREVSKKAVM